MGGFDVSFQRELAIHSWALYGVSMSFLVLRVGGRMNRVGFKRLLVDDWLMVLAGMWYTILIVCLNVIATGGGSNLFLPEEFATFTEEDIQERIKGSKIVVVSEQAMLNVIYTLKTCMLFMFFRLTNGSSQLKRVKALAAYVALGYVGTQFAFFFACRPFHGYWAVPPPNPQCTTLEHYAYAQATFNISSDLLMLFIPMPMIVHLRLPLKKKLILGGIFSMGVFVIIAAILTKVYNLSDVYSTTYMFWYIREASVAILVANLPILWGVLRDIFPALRSLSGTSSKPSQLPHSHTGGSRVRPSALSSPTTTGTGLPPHYSKPFAGTTVTTTERTSDGSDADSTDAPAYELDEKPRGTSVASDERGLRDAAAWAGLSRGGAGGIRAEVTIDIEREAARDDDWARPLRQVKIVGPAT